jgi:hypothetical protein
MQDFCFKCSDQAALLSALDHFGLVDDGRVVGDFVYAGQLAVTPGTYDPETGEEIAAPTYLDGEYAVLRLSDMMAAQISAATWPEGIALVEPPDGLPRFGGLWLTPDLDVLKAEACTRIDARAEELCNAVVTPGSAQMARYRRKEDQARAYLADPVPTADNYPAVFNEVGITGETPQEVAEAILARAAAWWTYGDAVERARLAGKRAALAATSVSGIATAEAGVAWPDLL